ncbi:energy transducer TonB [Massilia endophytica]|uniref:energy transducer TonB n=1 Tax=Massilia endophytica TaxID=2899220 RepID=UPI001E50D3CC|nr:energy transducer TonB [Massilia endophytica]UGQ48871.1 energy transducer TonB [Massilia endophytica]
MASLLFVCMLSGQASAAGLQARLDRNACEVPEYLMSWLDDDQQGDVTMKLLVGADGSVTDAELIESSGYRALDKASLRAGSKCKFKPAAKDGQITPGWIKVQYSWVIN